MDTEILEQILKFWFIKDAKNKIWFQRDKRKLNLLDLKIKQKYNNFLKFLENNNILKNYLYTISPKYCLSIIICLDQFSRHIYRNNTNKSKIIENTLRASDISMYLIKKYRLRYIFNSEELIFILMPLKHLDSYLNFSVLQNVIYNYNNQSLIICNPNLKSFWQDCLKKYYYSENHKPIKYKLNNNYTPYELSKVCEYFPIIEKPYKNNIVDKKLTKIINQFILDLNKINNDKIVISLSGGPDSMVLLDLFAKTRKYHNRKIIAFHIDYNNRKESKIEKELVGYFCNKLNVDLFTFTIRHMKRNRVDRDFYESTTRYLRFNLYRQFSGNVILGHIRDDLIENIWTNFANGRDLFKLHKMDKFSIIDRVHICRPFLEVEKKDILLYSKSNSIPYLKNTTPIWSNRGKLRNNFIPESRRQFGDRVGDKILYLSNSLVSYKNTLDKLVFKPLFNRVTYLENGLRLDISSYLDMDLHFWQTVLLKLFHKLDLSMPSIKSVRQFIWRLNNRRLGKIQLKKNVNVEINQFNNNIVLSIVKT